MQKIKMEKQDGSIGEYNACEVLKEINETEFFEVLRSINWSTTGKIDFLTGKIARGFPYTIAEPLTEAQAQIALSEYKNLLGYK